MADTTWHVWGIVLSDPDHAFQLVGSQDGDRPDGLPWTDPIVYPVRGQDTELDHIGSISGPRMGPYGMDIDLSLKVRALAPANLDVSTSVMTSLDTLMEPAQEDSEGLEAPVGTPA